MHKGLQIIAGIELIRCNVVMVGPRSSLVQPVLKYDLGIVEPPCILAGREVLAFKLLTDINALS